LCLAAVVCVLAGCGGDGSSTNATSGNGALIGAGSTFVFPLVAKWIPHYSKTHRVTITYGPIGSGGGIQQITNRTVDFGARRCTADGVSADIVQGLPADPWALAGTSIPYNLPGAPKHLKLTDAVIAAMFLGKIDSWNDPAIAKLNPGVVLPSLPVTPIYRRDASGTTYTFTDFLSHVSPSWKSRVGTGPTRWRSGGFGSPKGWGQTPARQTPG
jgi:phosphate transport system substrate-binding protein